MRTAVGVKIKAEALEAARLTGGSVEDEVNLWVVNLPDKMHRKLAKAGLVEPRAASQCVTLAELLERSPDSRTGSIKPSTILVHDQARQRLLEYFGADRPAKDIHEGDAELWAAWMVKQGLAEATRRKRAQNAKQFFAFAVRQRIVPTNPFTGLKSSAVGNDKRLFFVRKGDFEKILAEAPDVEWKLILALCRFGGLRCPSEVLALRWQDITWKPGRIHVTSSKTEGHEGGGSRTIPIFSELEPYLRDAFEQARPGATYCVERHRLSSINLRTQVRRFIRRAGLTPWERTFQNLRASRATELSEQYPIRTVTAWLGHSLSTATRLYLSVPDVHFERSGGVAQIRAQ
jgi:integrase